MDIYTEESFVEIQHTVLFRTALFDLATEVDKMMAVVTDSHIPVLVAS